MSKDTYRLDSPQSSAIWKKMVTRRRGEYLVRRKLVRHTKGSEFISWPTPQQRSCGGSKDITESQSEVLGADLKMLANPPEQAIGKQKQEQVGARYSGGSKKTRWPARPGEEQYEWEEPRVTEVNPNWVELLMGLSTGWTDLGSWGNGVVPQTAELAWKTLWKELNAHVSHQEEMNGSMAYRFWNKESIIRGLAWHSVSNIDTTQNAKQGKI